MEEKGRLGPSAGHESGPPRGGLSQNEKEKKNVCVRSTNVRKYSLKICMENLKGRSDY